MLTPSHFCLPLVSQESDKDHRQQPTVEDLSIELTMSKARAAEEGITKAGSSALANIMSQMLNSKSTFTPPKHSF